MGHLTRIANAVVQNMEKGPMHTQISEFIKGTLCSLGFFALSFRAVIAKCSELCFLHLEAEGKHTVTKIAFFPELPEDCRGRWESFVEETLTETNRRNTVDLVRAVMHVSVRSAVFWVVFNSTGAMLPVFFICLTLQRQCVPKHMCSAAMQQLSHVLANTVLCF